VAVTVRALLKSIAAVFATLLGGATSSVAREAPDVPTFSNLIARLRRDAALRGRFADDPRATLLENGIDPAPYNLPERISPTQMDRLLAQSTQEPPPKDPPATPKQKQQPGPPAVIYGPPPGPAPVYGPPPGPPPAPPK
jgi:hypothetical protein